MYGDKFFITKSFQCPLNLIPGMISTPRIFKEISFHSGIDEEILSSLVWCDLCNICNIAEYMMNFFARYARYYVKYFSNFITGDYEFHGESGYYIYFPMSCDTLSPSLLYVKKYINNLLEEINIGQICGPHSGALYFLAKIGSKVEEISHFKNIIFDNRIKGIITIDKYTDYILRKYFSSTLKNKVISLSKLLQSLIEKEDIIFENTPSLSINVLNSSYSFYRRELRNYSMVSKLLPSVKFFLSKKRFGSGLLSLVKDDFLKKSYVEILETYLPKRIKILAIVDPLLYDLIYQYGRRKDYIYSYLPNFFLGFMRKL